MKKTIPILLIIAVFCALFLSGCGNEYENKEVESIHFSTIDYMGGFQHHGYYNFNELTYSTKQIWGVPYPDDAEQEDIDLWNSLAEYNVKATFTAENATKFFASIKEHGIYKLKKKYEARRIVMDGGGWCLIITFADKTTFESSGSNNSPKQFEAIRQDFKALTGFSLFG